MNNLVVAYRSFFHYWRSNSAIALGVAAATAVLTGALIVGASMRGSLKDLTLDRLASVDEVLRSQGFFREQLAAEIRETDAFQDSYELAIPAIMLPNSTAEVESNEDSESSGQIVDVMVFGCNENFWKLDPGIEDLESLGDGEIIINRKLADDMGIVDLNSTVTIALRLPVGKRVAAESAMGEKEAKTEFIGELKVVKILENHGLGRFSMFPTQLVPRNAFISLERMQESLGPEAFKNKSSTEQVNAIFLKGKSTAPPTDEQTLALRSQLRPSLEDFDLRVKRVTQDFAQPAPASSGSVFDYISVSSDRMMLDDPTFASATNAFSNADPVFTYLANRISINRDDDTRPIPFSMITAVDFGQSFAPVSAENGQPIRPLAEDEIVLNSWTAEKLKAKIGDIIEVAYFEPETTEGDEVELTASFRLADIAEVVTPKTPFRIVGRDRLIPPQFDKRPTMANDPDLTPEVPGLTDAASVQNWKLPFPTPGITGDDETYWDEFRTTPKAFVSLATGKKLWSSRFGSATSLRIDASDIDKPAEADVNAVSNVERQLLDQIAKDRATLGFEIFPAKRHGLEASSGSTPFDGLFLGLSMFVIIAALMLVSILFQLSLQQRASEIGLLSATGISHKQITRIWIAEMVLVCIVGSILGVVVGVGYASLMLIGLRTWWVGAISTPFIQLHLDAISLSVGLFAGLVVCAITIWWSIFKTRKQSVRGLLAGQIDKPRSATGKARRWPRLASFGFGIAGIGLSVLAGFLAGESQAGAFLTAGFCFLSAMLLWIWNRLNQPASTKSTSVNSLTVLSWQSARRNPLRSTLTIGLVAAASFLIVSISSFRLAPSSAGTANFEWLMTTEQPIFEDLNSAEAQENLLRGSLGANSLVLPMKLKSGEDASCNNPYQSTQPRVLGVPQKFVEHFDSDEVQSFGWATTAAETKQEKANPWNLLTSDSDSEAIPAVIDKNTAWYSLKVYFVGSEFEVEFDTGQKAKFKVVGFLDNTILQGSLLIADDRFTKLFPESPGYRYFLMNLDETETETDSGGVSFMRTQLSDYGPDFRSTTETLSGFLAVQNTYLSTFQSLGALGLLLGTFGLAAVQMRSVLERKKELGLMRAIGFSQQRLGRFVLLENLFLLFVGLAVGVVAAAFVTLPHSFISQVGVPWQELFWMFGAILVVGIITSWVAAKWTTQVPIIRALRN